MKKYPEHWKMPTDKTLEQHKFGLDHGLVPTGAEILSKDLINDPRHGAYVPLDEITGKQARGIVERLDHLVHSLHAVNRWVAGMAATQIGEAAQVIQVPHYDPAKKKAKELLTVFNPTLEVDESAPKLMVAHGCYSQDEISVNLALPSRVILGGFDVNAEPIRLERIEFDAVVDQHEFWHLLGMLSADVAVASDPPIQLDCVPPEMLDEHKRYLRGNHPTIPNDPAGFLFNPEGVPPWHNEYPVDQYQAKRHGEFVLMEFIQQQ